MSEPKYTPTKGNEQKMIFQAKSRPSNSTNGQQFQNTPAPKNGISGGSPDEYKE